MPNPEPSGRSGRVPLHRRLLFRLFLVSAVVGACSVAATAWLTARTATGAIEREQGQIAADDARIRDRLLGYAATHTSWDGAGPDVRRLSEETGRHIVLASLDQQLLADSAPHTSPPPARSAAVLDPLALDTAPLDAASPGTHGTGDWIDPRAVGPYRLTEAERTRLARYAEQEVACLEKNGIKAAVDTAPNGRPTIRHLGRSTTPGPAPLCERVLERTTTDTERRALDQLDTLVAACLRGTGISGIRVGPDFSWSTTATGTTAANSDDITSCVAQSRREQLRAHVAPPARLSLGPTTGAERTTFGLSSRSTAEVAGLAALVFALSMGAALLAASPVVRPLRRLTRAAQQLKTADSGAPVPVRGHDEIGRLTAAFNDLSEHRARLESQRKAMISDIAHELRTPLSNIRGWLEAAQDGVATADAAYIDSLHDEALLLQHVIDDLRDLAALDDGRLTLHTEPTLLRPLLDQVAAGHQARAQAERITLVVDADEDLWLDADPARLRQAVGNLVTNAIRHTPVGGTVTLTGHPADQDGAAPGTGGGVRIEVRDTGPGIAEDDLPHVFDRFWRADKSRTRQSGGSGLGLAIVRDLTELHGGSVSATSEPGHGALFGLWLPSRDESRNRA
ncbi:MULTISPECIES: sensor histidine kinase [unclassified Streptomyces]|uniref:sensor histidine kinase n=1 Tax=unclassified Streptomyces TaxID=2593676 RepID=UPI00081DA3BD|nr:HAMP domain-containing sensor histidine kinase [Streptomyces sp. ScaeMP-e83]MYR97185.1 HAMP domain-containing protein [Streptomyces sp. SID4937]SCE21975.1 two-component system, OmpR family, sensor histidine kinase BaeS [Streptomyces sp. ScaeMP-e83]